MSAKCPRCGTERTNIIPCANCLMKMHGIADEADFFASEDEMVKSIQIRLYNSKERLKDDPRYFDAWARRYHEDVSFLIRKFVFKAE